MIELDKAYSTLIFQQVFFASILLRLKRVEDPSAKTAWTDGIHLGYNPEYIKTLTHAQRVGLLAHEVGHVVGLHPFRQQWRENEPWNIACDQAINPLVEGAGLELPPGALPGIADATPEQLYQKQSGGGGGGKQQKQQQGGGTGKQQQGGGAAKQPNGQQPGNGPPLAGEVRAPKNADGTQFSEAQREQAMQETRIAVAQAVAAAKARGNLPAGIARLVEEAEPIVPWQEVLAQFLDARSKSDYSFRKPNRRYAASNIIFPSLDSETFGKGVVGGDTSGSVGTKELKIVAAECLGLLEAYEQNGQEPELDIAWFDTKVYPQTITDVDQLKPQGGGGTDFRPVWKWANELETLPKFIVMLTDGMGTFGEDPGIPVLWVLVGRRWKFQPPFGEVAHFVEG